MNDRRDIKLVAVIMAASILSTATIPRASASTLPPQVCERHRAEQAAMIKTGARELLAKGPEWVRSNVGAAGIQQVRRLIELDELVLFRCPQPKPVALSKAQPGDLTVIAKPTPNPQRPR